MNRTYQLAGDEFNDIKRALQWAISKDATRLGMCHIQVTEQTGDLEFRVTNGHVISIYTARVCQVNGVALKEGEDMAWVIDGAILKQKTAKSDRVAFAFMTDPVHGPTAQFQIAPNYGTGEPGPIRKVHMTERFPDTEKVIPNMQADRYWEIEAARLRQVASAIVALYKSSATKYPTYGMLMHIPNANRGVRECDISLMHIDAEHHDVFMSGRIEMYAAGHTADLSLFLSADYVLSCLKGVERKVQIFLPEDPTVGISRWVAQGRDAYIMPLRRV